MASEIALAIAHNYSPIKPGLAKAIDAAIRDAVKAEREAILLLVASEREPSADDAPSYMIDGTITARDAAIAAVRATKRCINDRIRARTPQQETHDE